MLEPVQETPVVMLYITYQMQTDMISDLLQHKARSSEILWVFVCWPFLHTAVLELHTAVLELHTAVFEVF